MFDLRTMRVHWETNVGNGICGIEFDRKDVVMNKVSVSTLDSRVFVFDLRTRHPVKGYAFARQKAHKLAAHPIFLHVDPLVYFHDALMKWIAQVDRLDCPPLAARPRPLHYLRWQRNALPLEIVS